MKAPFENNEKNAIVLEVNKNLCIFIKAKKFVVAEQCNNGKSQFKLCIISLTGVIEEGEG